MSVYVGIEVHRKRSQVAVVAEDGKVQLKQEHGDRTEPTLRLIGDLPAGTPVAYGAAFGWSWLADLLEDYGLRPAPGAPAAVQGDRLSCEICQRTVAYRPGSLYLVGIVTGVDCPGRPCVNRAEERQRSRIVAAPRGGPHIEPPLSQVRFRVSPM